MPSNKQVTEKCICVDKIEQKCPEHGLQFKNTNTNPLELKEVMENVEKEYGLSPQGDTPEKCHCPLNKRNYTSGTGNGLKSECSGFCKSQKVSEEYWEKEFDERYSESSIDLHYKGDRDNIKSFIRKLQQQAREEGFKDAEDTFYAVMHQVRSEAGKNQLLILSKVSSMFRSLINQRGSKQ